MRHLLLAVGLVALALAGGVHYDAAERRHWPYPTEAQVHADYDAHVGEEALLFGTVRSVDPDAGTAVVVVDAGRKALVLDVRAIDTPIETGGVVQIYGTLADDRTVVAESVVVVERDPGQRLYKFAVSALGAGLALAAFFRDWRIEVSTMTFEPR